METDTDQEQGQSNVEHNISLLGHSASNLFELAKTADDYGYTTLFTHLDMAINHILQAALELERLSKLSAAERMVSSDHAATNNG